MSVVNMVVGATTPSGATFVAKVDTGPVRIAVDVDENMSAPTFFGPQAVDAQGVAKVVAAGLAADTQYFWQVEDNGVVDQTTGSFRTHPILGLPASFTVAIASCAGATPSVPGTGAVLAPNRLSNHSVFGTIRNHDPLMFIHMGDLHYYDLGSGNHGIVGGGTIDNYRRGYDDVLLQSQQAQLYRNVAWNYVWDDHDFGPDNSDGTLATKINAALAYREKVPSYDLTDPEGIWQQWRIGRIQFVASDTRYYRSPNATPDGGGLILDGVSGDYATTPDHASLDIMGDWDVRAEVTIDDWTAAAPDGVRGTVFAKWDGAQRSYWFGVENDGRLALFWSTTGTNSALRFSTSPVPITSGSLAIRGTLNANDGGNNTVTFFTAPNIDGPWTQLGFPVTNAGIATMFSGTAEGSVGAADSGTGRPFEGVIRRVEVRNQLSSLIADPDFAAQATGTTAFADSTGKTWTLQGNSEIVNKTMLGAAQKEWLEGLLQATPAEVLVWVMPSQWMGTGGDTWSNFASERDELAAMLESTGWADRMVMVYGDRHALGIDSGAGNDWGGFPVLQAASLDSSFNDPIGGLFDVLEDTPGRNQYGTIDINDLGSVILVRLNAWRGTELLGTHQEAFGIGEQEPDVSRVVNTITGSHDVVYEATILDTFQVGSQPSGTVIEILDGEVTLDGTADIRGKAKIRIPGQFGQDGPVAFPRARNRLVAPYGNEVFIRYGIDFGGGGVLWIPLGYYAIYTTDQDDAAVNPISLNLEDRMSPIVDSKLIDPREYDEFTPVAQMFDDLVRDIYPDAVIVFDDDTGNEQLGRQIVVESNRYEPMKEVAESYGKIVYFDTEGIMRIEAAPDPDNLVWQVRAGRNGVLINGRRQVSRKGFANAFIVVGEGGDSREPIRGVAYDADPNSPTRFGGPMGRVPKSVTTPLVTEVSQAQIAARELMRREIGAPHNVDFDAITNPLLRPFQAVRIVYGDGTRDIHIIDSVNIPLDENKSMSAKTREKVLVVIGSLVTESSGGGAVPLIAAGG